MAFSLNIPLRNAWHLTNENDSQSVMLQLLGLGVGLLHVGGLPGTWQKWRVFQLKKSGPFPTVFVWKQRSSNVRHTGYHFEIGQFLLAQFNKFHLSAKIANFYHGFGFFFFNAVLQPVSQNSCSFTSFLVNTDNQWLYYCICKTMYSYFGAVCWSCNLHYDVCMCNFRNTPGMLRESMYMQRTRHSMLEEVWPTSAEAKN